MPPRESDQIPYEPEKKEAPAPSAMPGHSDHVVPIRTLSSDLARAVREQGGSVVKIAMAEDEKRRTGYAEAIEEPKKNRMLLIVSIILIIVAAGALVGVYLYKKDAPVTVTPTTTLPQSIVRAEEASALDLSNKNQSEILAAIATVVADPKIRLGTMRNVVPVKISGGIQTRITPTEFLNAVGAELPADLRRTLSADYMLGVYLFDGSDLFLVLRGTAHDFMLAGMLQWENTLLRDLSPTFGINHPDLVDKTFSDELIQNRNTRAVVDAEGTPILFYSFLDDNTIVITADQKTLVEVVRRFER